MVPPATNQPPDNVERLTESAWQEFVRRLCTEWTAQYFLALTNRTVAAEHRGR
jgi:hypothetical protein